MADDTQRHVGLTLWILLHFMLAGYTIYAYVNPESNISFVERGIRSGPDRREKCATKLLAFGVAIAGAAMSFKRRSLGFGLMAASYLVDAARMEIFHVREGGRLFDAEFMAPWMMMMLGLWFCWIALVARDRDVARSALEEVK